MNKSDFKIKPDAGDTKIIRTKEQKERRKQIQKAFDAAMKKYDDQEFVKCKSTITMGGLYAGHPKEKHFTAEAGTTLMLPQAQFDSLKKIGRVEAV